MRLEGSATSRCSRQSAEVTPRGSRRGLSLPRGTRGAAPKGEVNSILTHVALGTGVLAIPVEEVDERRRQTDARAGCWLSMQRG